MDLGVRSHGMKADPPGYLWSKHECFLMSGWWDIPHLICFNIKLWSNSTNGTKLRTNLWMDERKDENYIPLGITARGIINGKVCNRNNYHIKEKFATETFHDRKRTFGSIYLFWNFSLTSSTTHLHSANRSVSNTWNKRARSCENMFYAICEQQRCSMISTFVFPCLDIVWYVYLLYPKFQDSS